MLNRLFALCTETSFTVALTSGDVRGKLFKASVVRENLHFCKASNLYFADYLNCDNIHKWSIYLASLLA